MHYTVACLAASPGSDLISTLRGKAATAIGAFAADRQRVALNLKIGVFRVDSWQHHLAMKLPSILLNERPNGGAESSRRHRGLFLSQGPAQEAIENLVEIPAEVAQILEEMITRNKTCRNPGV